jgi:hypothetical protein
MNDETSWSEYRAKIEGDERHNAMMDDARRELEAEEEAEAEPDPLEVRYVTTPIHQLSPELLAEMAAVRARNRG